MPHFIELSKPKLETESKFKIESENRHFRYMQQSNKVFLKVADNKPIELSDIECLFEALTNKEKFSSNVTNPHLDEKYVKKIKPYLERACDFDKSVTKEMLTPDFIQKILEYQFPIQLFCSELKKIKGSIITQKFVNLLNAMIHSSTKKSISRKRRHTIGGNRRKSSCTKRRRNKMKGGHFVDCNIIMIRLFTFFLLFGINAFTIEPINEIIYETLSVDLNGLRFAAITLLLIIVDIYKINIDMIENILRRHGNHIAVFISFIIIMMCELLSLVNAANLLTSYSIIEIYNILSNPIYRDQLCGIDPMYRNYVNITCSGDIHNKDDPLNTAECIICTQSVNNKEFLIEYGVPINFHKNTPGRCCKHIFHRKCLNWFMQDKEGDMIKCPLCFTDEDKAHLYKAKPMSVNKLKQCFCTDDS